MMKSVIATLALAAVLVPASAFADPHEHGHGGGHAVPEINGTNAGLALALVVGGAAVVLGRRRKQNSAS